jgi:DNA polymerase III epsilon subunit family exonuclease
LGTAEESVVMTRRDDVDRARSGVYSSYVVQIPSGSQRAAIEGERKPLLVVAGPGSGKTFCLIERIRFLIRAQGIAPERICAFTFTNKAAEEIAARLDQVPNAALVKRTTIHKLCVDLLREHGERLGIPPGFGIADDEYQMSVLWRLESNPAKRNALPKRFTLHRLRGDELHRENARRLEQYEGILRKQNLLDFDMLLLKTRDLLHTIDDVRETVRARWDAVLIDEFQDLNPVQYQVIKALAIGKKPDANIFAVGDYDQSIYGWAGAEPKVFSDYQNDFKIIRPIALLENRRCPRNVFQLARAFVETNPMLPGFDERPAIVADKESDFEIEAVAFDDSDEEIQWIIRDVHQQIADYPELGWGDFALLYRTHSIGDLAEPAMLAAGIPCRLAHGRAIAEDKYVRYVATALRIILDPRDDIHKEAFLSFVLPRTFRDVVKAEAEANCEAPIDRLRRLSRQLPRDDENGKRLRRAFYAIRNFGVVARRHKELAAVVEELLSQRVGEYRTALEREHHLISDPETLPEAQALAFRIAGAIKHERVIAIPHMDGAEIPVAAMLHGAGVRTVRIGFQAGTDLEYIAPTETPEIGLALATFKAAQILASRKLADTFSDYTAIDLETTGKDPNTCSVVDIAAVRVRDGKIVEEFSSLVNPQCPIPADATRTHGIRDADVATAPTFAEVWPRFREFCGNDVVVAHNGYDYDFKVLNRLAGGLQGIGTYDTLPLAKELVPESRTLEHLARKYSVETGRSHRALDDARCLSKVFLRLNEAKLALTRKTSAMNLLDQLGVALALSGPHSEDSEAKLLQHLATPYSLGAMSECLEYYQAMRMDLDDATLPTVDHVIERLGGEKLMARFRSKKGAHERYPIAMMRLQRLMAGCEGGELTEQIGRFLERVALSVRDGLTADRNRVNLLTLHSTKGLEFSRVYILGVEDGQFIPGERPTKPEIEEARRVLYVGMTRAVDRLVMTRVAVRNGKPTGGTQFLNEMEIVPRKPTDRYDLQSLQPLVRFPTAEQLQQP